MHNHVAEGSEVVVCPTEKVGVAGINYHVSAAIRKEIEGERTIWAVKYLTSNSNVAANAKPSVERGTTKPRSIVVYFAHCS